MARSTIKDRRAYYVDAEVILHASAAESGTHSTTGVAFNATKEMGFKLVVVYQDIGGTVNGANYWDVQLEVATTQGGSYSAVGENVVIQDATGQTREVIISGVNTEYILSEADWVRVTTTETGTTAGDITYEAFLSPL